MKPKISKFKDGAKKALQSLTKSASKATRVTVDTTRNVAVSVFDQDGDGKFDQEDIRILSTKTADAGKAVISRSGELLNEASKSAIVKDAAAGAAVGAAVAIPVPIIGPATGAVVGAGLGVYKNITGKGQHESSPKAGHNDNGFDVYSEILKLGDLKDKGLITEEEYVEQKRLLLDRVKNISS